MAKDQSNNQSNITPPYNPEVSQGNQPIYNLNTQPQQQTYYYNHSSNYSDLFPKIQPQNNTNNQQQSGYYNPNSNYSDLFPKMQHQNNTNNQRNFPHNNDSGNNSKPYDPNCFPHPEKTGSPLYPQSTSQTHYSNTQDNQGVSQNNGAKFYNNNRG